MVQALCAMRRGEGGRGWLGVGCTAACMIFHTRLSPSKPPTQNTQRACPRLRCIKTLSVLCQHGAARATQEYGQRISPTLSQTQQNGLRCLELGLLPLCINPHQCDKSIVGTKLKSQSCLPMNSERTTSLSNYFDLLHFWELPTFAFFIILLLLVHTDFLIALWVM